MVVVSKDRGSGHLGKTPLGVNERRTKQIIAQVISHNSLEKSFSQYVLVHMHYFDTQ